MRYLTLSKEEKSSYKICILVNDIRKDEILRAYINPYGLNQEEIIVISLHKSQTKKKTPVSEQKDYINEMLAPTINDLGVKYVMVADGDYFKTMAKVPKIDASLGYMMDTEFGPWKIAYIPNYRTLFYDPVKVTQNIAAGINALTSSMANNYVDPGNGIIEFEAYPDTVEDIAYWLDRLLEMDVPLTIDIEAFSLKHYNAGIGTIAFAWSKTEGIAFNIDYKPIPGAKEAPFGNHIRNDVVHDLLKAFFIKLKNKAVYHSINFDVTVLIYQLFMNDITDQRGLLSGLEIMTRNWDCTRLISYLATNSCAGNKLSLKDQAQEYAGNYAQEEIKDITKIRPEELLRYNLVDCLATWFTYEKNWPKVISDQQEDIYKEIFKPAMKDIIQMQLTGMPVNMHRIKEVKQTLHILYKDALKRIKASNEVKAFHSVLANQWMKAKNAKLKVKRVTAVDFKEEFNPNSDPQLQKLLFEEMGLPVLDYTKTKAPATGGKTLDKLLNHVKTQDAKDFLVALIEFKALSTILETFIPALESSQLGADGWYWLFGSFNLGGTVSGRLSSSGPNLQNIPANVAMKLPQEIIDKYPLLKKFAKKGELSLGKLIKYCFMAPPGWFFCGIDFASLEDKISALTTKDPNKIKVYTDGYDGHSLRAYSYFGDQMTGIIDGDVESINSIQDNYKSLRQDSKTPTFLLTYGGTYIGIMQQLGWPEAKAKSVEFKYHELYAASDKWIQDKLKQACKDGFVTVAFGLRVRTPLLHQVVLGTSKTPFQAEAEGRTAGNAMGQSWCLLNSRAMSEFMGDVRINALKFSIKPCAQIHDANYILAKDDIDVIHYCNKYLVKACEWQNHPDIAHPDVKLGGEFSIFYPDWSSELSLKNNAKPEEIMTAFQEHYNKL